MNLFHAITIPLLTFSLFGHHPISPPTLPVEKKMLSLTADYYPIGSDIHVQASFPQNGGKIQGTISGACTGEINGQYTGDARGKKVLGIVYAKCHILFFTVNVDAVFNGTANDSDTSADVNYDAILDNHRVTGSYSFPLTAN